LRTGWPDEVFRYTHVGSTNKREITMIHPVYEYVRIYYAAVSYNPFFRSEGFRFVAGGRPLAGGMENEEQREKSHIYICIYYVCTV